MRRSQRRPRPPRRSRSATPPERSCGLSVRKLTRGLNRIAWELDRDAFKRLPSNEPPEPDATPGGPSLPPGTYELTVKFRGESATAPVRVLPDPRSKNSDADWQARYRAVAAAGALREAVATAVERLRATRSDVEAIVSRERDANAEKIRRREVKSDELPLAKSAEKLQEGLTKLEKELWQPPDTVGIVAETDAFSKLLYVQGYLASSWDPPNPTHLEYLRQARVAIDARLAEVNRFYAEEVALFRKEVESSGPRLLPELPPLAVASE